MGSSASKGPTSVKDQLAQVRDRAEDKFGKVAISGRYHLPPKFITDDYVVEMNNILGTGVNGAVVVGRDKHTDEEVAIKPYTSAGINKEEQRTLRNEVEIFLSLDHPHITKLINVYEENHQLWLVMEVCTGGEILAWIEKRGVFDERKAADLVYQMLLSVNYLHARRIVHRDLKLENFLFETAECEHVKLIDFGMSRYWTNNRKMKVACGTITYIAPECLNNSYTIQCDMWSMGVIAYVLLSGQMPFNGTEAEMIAAIREGQYSLDGDNWKGVSDQGKDFVRSLMTLDVDKRLTAEDALKHSWIDGRSQMLIRRNSTVDHTVVKALQDFSNASAFRRACCSLMAYDMPLEERKGVRDAFMELDTEQTGMVKLKELKKVLGDRVTDGEAKKMFDSLQTNSEDYINYTDFLAAMMTSRIAKNETHLKAAFNRLDRDGTGFISTDNIIEVIGNSYEGLDADGLMASLDIDGNGSISYEEFMEYIQGDDAHADHQEAVLRVIDYERSFILGSTPTMPDQWRLTAPAPIRPTMSAPAEPAKERSRERRLSELLNPEELKAAVETAPLKEACHTADAVPAEQPRSCVCTLL